MQKVQYLKQAKEEADAEIRAYKQQREAQFQMFSKEVRERAPGSRRDTYCACPRHSVAEPRCARRDRSPPPVLQRMGDTGAHSKDTQAATEQELRMIGTQVANNKDKMVSMLLQSVTSVGL